MSFHFYLMRVSVQERWSKSLGVRLLANRVSEALKRYVSVDGNVVVVIVIAAILIVKF